jgi:hypothetical protein
MTEQREKDLRVLIYKSENAASPALESCVRLPEEAQFEDFIDALRAASPEVFEEVRRRVMRAAGRVLAYGRDDPLLVAIDEKLIEGGTLVFPAEEETGVAETIRQPQPLGR